MEAVITIGVILFIAAWALGSGGGGGKGSGGPRRRRNCTCHRGSCWCPPKRYRISSAGPSAPPLQTIT